MNGRLFDATLGRFLQGDPLIQDPNNLQNYNRYGYCFNNPMTCSDPSGLGFASFLKWLDPIGYAAHKWMSHSWIGRAYIQAEISVGSSWCGWWAAACYGAGEAVFASMTGASDSQALKTGLISGVAYAAGQGMEAAGAGWVGQAVVGCASSRANGGSCRSGAYSSAFNSAFGSSGSGGSGYTVQGAMWSAFVGGVGSVIGGGKFRDGAASGAFGYLSGPLRQPAGASGSTSGGSSAGLAPDVLIASNDGGGPDYLGAGDPTTKGEVVGRPLTDTEKTLYASYIPQNALNVAVVFDGKVPFWLKSEMDGITLGNNIYFRPGAYVPDSAGGAEILGHELVHVSQYLNGMTYAGYLWESRNGYRNNKYEVEAYSVGAKIRADFCNANPGKAGC